MVMGKVEKHEYNGAIESMFAVVRLLHWKPRILNFAVTHCHAFQYYGKNQIPSHSSDYHTLPLGGPVRRKVAH